MSASWPKLARGVRWRSGLRPRLSARRPTVREPLGVLGLLVVFVFGVRASVSLKTAEITVLDVTRDAAS